MHGVDSAAGQSRYIYIYGIKCLLGFIVEDSRPIKTQPNLVQKDHFQYQTLKMIMLKLFGSGLQEWSQASKKASK